MDVLSYRRWDACWSTVVCRRNTFITTPEEHFKDFRELMVNPEGPDSYRPEVLGHKTNVATDWRETSKLGFHSEGI
jgi:hypothetical protein